MDAPNEQQLYNLLLLAEEQHKTAAAAVTAMEQERRELTKAVEGFKQAAALLPKAVGEAAARAMKESIGDAPKAAAQVLNRATATLKEAADTIEVAGTWVCLKTAVAVSVVGILVIGMIYVFGRYTLSSTLDDIENLRAEKAELEANIALLRKRGGKARLHTCGGRVCVEVSRNQGKDFENWEAPWKTHTGANLVILRGY